MKTKYLFIKCSGEISESTLLVDAWVGTSAQDQRDHEFLQRLAQTSHDYYYHIYDLDVSRYVQRIDLSLKSVLSDSRARLLRCSMPVRKLRRLLKNGLFDEWARTYFLATRGLRRMNLCENHAYFLAVGRADQSLAMPHT